MKKQNPVKRIRLKAKKNQTEFAESIGVNQSYLSKIESGKASLHLPVLQNIVVKYKVSMRKLVEELVTDWWGK